MSTQRQIGSLTETAHPQVGNEPYQHNVAGRLPSQIGDGHRETRPSGRKPARCPGHPLRRIMRTSYRPHAFFILHLLPLPLSEATRMIGYGRSKVKARHQAPIIRSVTSADSIAVSFGALLVHFMARIHRWRSAIGSMVQHDAHRRIIRYTCGSSRSRTTSAEPRTTEKPARHDLLTGAADARFCCP